jgi:hypothetical protein
MLLIPRNGLDCLPGQGMGQGGHRLRKVKYMVCYTCAVTLFATNDRWHRYLPWMMSSFQIKLITTLRKLLPWII